MEKFIPGNANGQTVNFIAVSAHKDDIEMMAFDGIVKSLKGDGGFVAAVLTDGGACPRAEEYKDVDDEDMAALRTAEQKRAAEAGGYSALYLLEKKSAEVKRGDKEIIDNLVEIFEAYPAVEVLYLHNPFDRHPTHVAACLRAIEAVQRLSEDKKPKRIIGCEVWRDLDWLPNEDKIVMDVSGNEAFSAALMDSFTTQNAVKRYDIASIARRKANATYFESHEGDDADALIYGVDLTALKDAGASVEDFVNTEIDAFRREILRNLAQ